MAALASCNQPSFIVYRDTGHHLLKNAPLLGKAEPIRTNGLDCQGCTEPRVYYCSSDLSFILDTRTSVTCKS